MSRKRQDVSDLRGCAERFRARKKRLVQPTRYAIVRSTTASFAVDVTLETEIVIVRALHIERHRTDRIGWLRAAVLALKQASAGRVRALFLPRSGTQTALAAAAGVDVKFTHGTLLSVRWLSA